MDRETLQALASFKEELEDRIYRLRPLINSLPQDAMQVDPDSVHTIFRELHSLKGAANLLDLRPIGQLAHKMEDLLSKVRNGEIVFDGRLRNLLSAGVDRIEDLGQDLRKLRLMDIGRELAEFDRVLLNK